MRTPVILVAGQDHTDEVTGALLRRTGTVVVEHRFDGHVVRRMTATLSRGELITTEDALEFAHGCVSCTIRDDLLVLLRRLHRRDNVGRIVVHLAPWLEPQPICWAIDHVRVCVGHGYPDGPAALDVRVAAVVTCGLRKVAAAVTRRGRTARRAHGGPSDGRSGRVRRPSGADPPGTGRRGGSAPTGPSSANHRRRRPRRAGAGASGRQLTEGSYRYQVL